MALRRQAAWPLCLFGMLSGCAQQPVPSWLVLDHPREVRSSSFANQSEELVRELGRAIYFDSDISPEQLAAMAIEQLDRRHPWDAAVVLSLASYRRFQQVQYFQGTGARTRELAIFAQHPLADPARVADMNAKLSAAEVQAYGQASFDDELERVSALVGTPLKAEDLRDDVMRIVVGGVRSRHLASQALAQRVDTLRAPPEPRLAHPEVAEALRNRLVHDSEDSDLHGRALQGLAQVPLPRFREAALRSVRLPFFGPVMRTAVWLYKSHPEAVLAALYAEHPAVRLHAAAVIGFSEDLTQLDRLERSLMLERDSVARLGMYYSLIRLGEHQHLEDLVRGLRSTMEIEAMAATALVQWLPPDVKQEVSESDLVGVIDQFDVPHLQFLAAYALVDIGTGRALDQAAFSAIGKAFSALMDDEGYSDAVEALVAHVGELSQLSRGYVLERLRKSRNGTVVWLSLLRQHAKEQDLELLAKLMNERDGPVRVWALRVVAGIAGNRAQALLEQWYANEPSLRMLISALLVLRESTDKTRIDGLVAQVGEDDPTTAVLQLALGRPGAAQRVRAQLASLEPGERYEAIRAVRFLGGSHFDAELWEAAGYYADRHYPSDVAVRTSALSALLHLRLNRRFGDLEHGAVAAEATTRPAPGPRAILSEEANTAGGGASIAATEDSGGSANGDELPEAQPADGAGSGDAADGDGAAGPELEVPGAEDSSGPVNIDEYLK